MPNLQYIHNFTEVVVFLHHLDKIKNEIINFQLELALNKDSGCYTIEDIPIKVTVTLNGELHKKLNIIADLKCVSLGEVIEEMLSEKADETDMNELRENYYYANR